MASKATGDATRVRPSHGFPRLAASGANGVMVVGGGWGDLGTEWNHRGCEPPPLAFARRHGVDLVESGRATRGGCNDLFGSERALQQWQPTNEDLLPGSRTVNRHEEIGGTERVGKINHRLDAGDAHSYKCASNGGEGWQVDIGAGGVGGGDEKRRGGGEGGGGGEGE